MSRKCDLSIVLEQPEQVLTVGDTISGFVGVEVNSTAACHALTITLRWHTHGRGNRTTGEVEVVHLFEGELSAGETHLHPFQVTIPREGPLTYHGQLMNIDWELEARADIPWARDPKAKQELVVVQSSPPQPLTRGPLWTQQSPAMASAMQGVVMGVVGMIFLGMGTMGAAVTARGMGGGGGLLFALMPLVFAAVGLGMIWYAVRNHLARSRLGDVSLSVPEQARPGELVEVVLSFRPRQALQLNGASATLRGQEVVVSGSGTKKHTYRRQLHLDERTLADAQQVQGGQEVVLSGTLLVPEGAPPSFAATNNELRWDVQVDLDIARWPDWKRSLRLAVGR